MFTDKDDLEVCESVLKKLQNFFGTILIDDLVAKGKTCGWKKDKSANNNTRYI